MRTREHKFYSSKKIAEAHEKFHHQFDFTITFKRFKQNTKLVTKLSRSKLCLLVIYYLISEKSLESGSNFKQIAQLQITLFGILYINHYHFHIFMVSFSLI